MDVLAVISKIKNRRASTEWAEKIIKLTKIIIDETCPKTDTKRNNKWLTESANNNSRIRVEIEQDYIVINGENYAYYENEESKFTHDLTRSIITHIEDSNFNFWFKETSLTWETLQMTLAKFLEADLKEIKGQAILTWDELNEVERQQYITSHPIRYWEVGIDKLNALEQEIVEHVKKPKPDQFKVGDFVIEKDNSNFLYKINKIEGNLYFLDDWNSIHIKATKTAEMLQKVPPPKFKRGDAVIRLATTITDIITDIRYVNLNTNYMISFDNGTNWYNEDLYSHVPQIHQEIISKFSNAKTDYEQLMVIKYADKHLTKEWSCETVGRLIDKSQVWVSQRREILKNQAARIAIKNGAKIHTVLGLLNLLLNCNKQ